MTLVSRASRRAPRLLSALAFVASLLPVVHARADVDEVTRLEEQAARAFRENRLAEAFDKFKTLYEATGLIWDACNAGRTAYLLGRMPEAYTYLALCDSLGSPPEDQSKFSARERKVLRDAETTLLLAIQHVGRFKVYVDEFDADVFIDGKRVGSSPLSGLTAVEPGRHCIKATLGDASVEVDTVIAAGQLRSVNLFLRASPPKTVEPLESEPGEPVEPVEPVKSEPVKSAGLATPLPAQQPEPRALSRRATLLWSAGGVLLFGTGISIGAFMAREAAIEDMERQWPDKTVLGCKGATTQCAAFDEATAHANTARQVFSWSTGVTIAVAGSLAVAGVFAVGTTPLKIEAFPTVGGMVVRGTF